MPTKSVRSGDFNPLRFSMPPPRKVDPDERLGLIAKAAYYRAERRNFEPGHEVEDWLAAEAEVDRRLAQTFRPPEDR